MPILKKSNDFILYKKGTAQPTPQNGYITDDNITLTQNPITYDLNCVGNGKGNTKETRYVKDFIPYSISTNLCLMEPNDINSDLPQLELFEAAGFKQEKVQDTSITLYPSLEAQEGVLVYYRGGIMKYIFEKVIGKVDFTADAANTKFTPAFEFYGINNPSTIANESGITPTFVQNDFFRLTKDSYITVNGEQICPFAEISLTLESEIYDGSDTVVCRTSSLDDYAPTLSFSALLNSDSDKNLTALTNWLNDSQVTISFPLFSKNFKLEIKINNGKEMLTEDGESGLRFLQKRNIRLLNDSNGRPFEFVITPL